MKPLDKAKQAATLAAMKAMLFRERVESGVSWNPLDHRFYSNPYPLYRQLRTKDPVHRSRLQDLWVLTRYDEIDGALRSPDFSADNRNQKNYEKERQKAIKARGRGGQRRRPDDAPDRPAGPHPPAHTRQQGVHAASGRSTAGAGGGAGPRPSSMRQKHGARWTSSRTLVSRCR